MPVCFSNCARRGGSRGCKSAAAATRSACCAKAMGSMEQAVTATRNLLRSNTQHHDLGGLDESGDGFSLLQAHLARGIGGDDGGDDLAADGEAHLRQQSLDFQVD